MKNAAPLAAAIVALAASMTTFGCQNSSSPCSELSGTDAVEWSPRLRGDVEAALPLRQEVFEADPNDDEARRAYAEVLFKLGDIWEADEVIRPLGTTSTCHAGDLRLAARTAYLLGDYERSVALNGRFLELADEGSALHTRAIRGLTLSHYQTNDFARARELPAPTEAEGSASLLTFMQAFEGQPYGIEWATEDKIAHLAMTNDITQPGALPLVTLDVNGEAVDLILDTGGDRLYLDKGIFERLGLPALAHREARYAYTQGETVEEPLGVAATVTMGDVTLTNVPVIGATWKALDQTSDGVLTTQILKQFLTTVDYDNRRITFRERSAEALAAVMATLGDTSPVEAPFYMTSTHLMFAKGSLNRHEGMNYFLDSGLAASMPLVSVEETVEFLGLDKNEIEGTPYYWSPIESHGLDGLPSGPAQALGNVFVEDDFFWQFGFMADALISHQYLWPKGSWTIDFDQMTYYFPVEASQVLRQPPASPVTRNIERSPNHVAPPMSDRPRETTKLKPTTRLVLSSLLAIGPQAALLARGLGALASQRMPLPQAPGLPPATSSLCSGGRTTPSYPLLVPWPFADTRPPSPSCPAFDSTSPRLTHMLAHRDSGRLPAPAM